MESGNSTNTALVRLIEQSYRDCIQREKVKGNSLLSSLFHGMKETAGGLLMFVMTFPLYPFPSLKLPTLSHLSKLRNPPY